MGNYTREEILQMVEEEDVEFIRLQFTDMFGAIKNIAVPCLPRFPEYIADCFCTVYHPENTDHRSFVPLFPAVDATAGLQMYQVQV